MLKTKVALLLTFVGVVAACGSDPASPSTSIAGHYTLRRVDGAALPAILEVTATDTVRAISGSATIRDNGTWTGEINLMISSGGSMIPTTEGGSGTYTRNGATVQLREATDGSVLVATLQGNKLILTVEGALMEFERR